MMFRTPYISHLGFFDFVSAMANPILGALRLVPYEKPLGYLMVMRGLGNNETLASTLGPNDQFYVLSHIYFGFIFGPFYCAFVGYCVSKARILLFTVQNPSPIKLTSFLTVGIIIFTLPLEASLFVSQMFDTFVPVAFACVIVYTSLSAARYGIYRSAQKRGSRSNGPVTEFPLC